VDLYINDIKYYFYKKVFYQLLSGIFEHLQIFLKFRKRTKEKISFAG